MIKRDELLMVGKVGKPHGIHGEMSCQFTTDAFDITEIGFIVLCIDGIFVPFFINGARTKGRDTLLLLLDGIDDEQQARALLGQEIYVPRAAVDESAMNVGLEYFVGFTLHDDEVGEVGVIEAIDDSTENVLFVIGDRLVPVSEDWVREVDVEQKKLFMQLPSGLLDL